MDNYKVAFIESATVEIEQALKLNPFEDMDLIILKYSSIFEKDTKGNVCKMVYLVTSPTRATFLLLPPFYFLQLSILFFFFFATLPQPFP